MFSNSPWKHPEFHFRELHKKIGQLIYMEPSESDIAEGNFMAKLWFRDDKMNLYLIHEHDVRDKNVTCPCGKPRGNSEALCEDCFNKEVFGE